MRAARGCVVVVAAVALAGCGSTADIGAGGTAAPAGCVTLDAGRYSAQELLADADAGLAAAGDSAAALAPVPAFVSPELTRFADAVPDGGASSFSKQLCASDAYGQDLEWQRAQGFSAAEVDNAAALYDAMRNHPGLVIASLGLSTCAAVEMFGGQLDPQSLVESESPLQAQAGTLALQYLCPTPLPDINGK